ncbi:MAG: hypothetical protein WBX20_09810 [Terrimicrobiaceae bacterium]
MSRALKALLLKGAPSRPGETSGEVYFPSPQAHALDAFQESEPSFKGIGQFWGEGQIAKRAAFYLEANGDNQGEERQQPG